MTPYEKFLKISVAKKKTHQNWRAKQDPAVLREKSRLAMRKWRAANREKALAAGRRSDKNRNLSSNERKRLKYARDVAYREATKKTARAWITNNHANWLLRQIKLRAKKTGVKFNLTIDDIVVPKLCPVFGIKLYRGAKHSCDHSPTVDRIKANKGYIKGNVAVISRLANSLKGKATAKQHRRIAEWMETFK